MRLERQRTIICENHPRNASTIACPVGRTINVLDTNYGRLHESTCSNTDVSTCDDNGASLPVIREMCDGERVCFLHAYNDVWDDTCFGTSKYLEIDYECGTL